MEHFNKRMLSNIFSPFYYILFAGILLMSCSKSIDTADSGPGGVPQALKKNVKDFIQVNLVGSDDEYAPERVDPLLKNPWGISFSGGGTAWISAEATGVSTVYTANGAQGLPAVAIPSPGEPSGGHPTGQVFNSSSDFKLPNGNPARFIFDGVDGVISGWNGGTAAIRMVNKSGTAVYTGLAIGSSGGNNYLFAANFSAGKIDVFDKNWAEVSRSFVDPGLPDGYSPFNIENISNQLFVLYAKVGADGEEEVHPGAGYVSVFNTDGSFVKRFTSQGQLNAPWGIAKAHPGFYDGDATGDSTILIGNFGDGRINAFTLQGDFIGQLRAHGNPIILEGLWAIKFPPASATAVDHNRLYFAAGVEDEEEGLFGYIIKE